MSKQSDKAVRAAGLPAAQDREQVARPQARYTYTSGPMFYLGQQLVRSMQDCGWNARIHALFRSPSDQEQAFKRRVTKARAFQSPHQFYCAVDIIDARKGWDVPARFWTDLEASVQVVQDKFKVPLEHGHRWKFTDSAHVELRDWRLFRDALPPGTIPDQAALDGYFRQLMPSVWRQYLVSKGYKEDPSCS